jgi:3-methyl-2-oxobutanoate hydroxymethyltransferase
MKKKNINTFYQSKGKRKISLLTAYDYSTAKLIDSCGIDALLVGDSLGMVCLGYKDTLSVTVEDMIHHAKAVVRGRESAMVIVDMPFMSYEISVEEALRNGGRIIKESGADALKLEGGKDIIPQVEALVKSKIPVMGHLGLTPQSVNLFGGYKIQGKREEDAKKLIDDALSLEEAGVFSIVLECIPAPLAKIISEKLRIPTIGIGAGINCDGQILVWQDLVKIYGDFSPKFVKNYADVGSIMKKAFIDYIGEVEKGIFPEEKHSFSMNEDILRKLY